MITSNQIIKLSEEWLMLIKSNYSSAKVDIYVNPTTSDYLELQKKKIKYLRFIADNRNKRIYVADALNVVHQDMVKNLKELDGLKTGYNNFSSWFLSGNAGLSGNSSKMTYSDMVDNVWRDSIDKNSSVIKRKKSSDILDTILSTDWSWCNKYVKVTDWLLNFKNQINKLSKK